MKGVIADIAAERQRQIDQEGWSHEHDDKHTNGEIAAAAATYAWLASLHEDAREEAIKRLSYSQPGIFAVIHDLWPKSWDSHWLKPTNPRRDLEKAGALIVAEIERLDRLALRETE